MGKELPGMTMAALMGPNMYNEMAADEFAEATIGCSDENQWPMLRDLFDTNTFHVDMSKDLAAVDLCGCLKNTVTISCGIAVGLGWGSNVKTAIMRRGLLENGQFLQEFANGDARILLSACGVGDVVLSCFAGRGQQLAAAFVQARGQKGWQDLEDEIMGGMKIPDWGNVREVYKLLSSFPGAVDRYPLLVSTYRIAFEGAKPESILEPLRMPPPQLKL
jgi:glycerol-3-phosphate dehydrogenase (NAD+)